MNWFVGLVIAAIVVVVGLVLVVPRVLRNRASILLPTPTPVDLRFPTNAPTETILRTPETGITDEY